MRSRAVVLAAALVLAPLGAQAADLVVWWDEGYYAEEDEAVREIIAAFEQETGKQVELVFHPMDGAAGQDRGGARGGPAARLRLRLLALADYIGQWAFDDRLVDLSDTIGHFSDLFDPDALDRCDAAQREDRARRLCTRLPMGQIAQPRPRLEEPPGAGGLHARRHPQGVGSVLVVLVRSGAAGGAPGHGPRRHLGRRASDVGRRCRHRQCSSTSSWLPTRRIT